MLHALSFFLKKKQTLKFSQMLNQLNKCWQKVYPMCPLNTLQYTVARQQIHLKTFSTVTSKNKYTNPLDTQPELGDAARWTWTTSVNLG